jgi:ring-1,2-phenylacetyl-CoA epoxidase subunit PaaA
MYTTELNKNVKPIETAEDPELVAAFEARVAADEFIEPKDWMPEAYRKTLVRQISPACAQRDRRHAARRQLDHARAVASAQGDPARQGAGRGGHGLYLYCAAETLGTSREQMIEALHSGKAKYSTIFNYRP